MNRNHILMVMALAALAAVSCQTKDTDIQVPAAEQEPQEIQVTFNAGWDKAGDTKTVRQPDGKVFWCPGDAINIIYGNWCGAGQQFNSLCSEPSATTSFTGTLPSGVNEVCAVYPYSSSSYLAERNETDDYYYIVVPNCPPAQQLGVPGTFENGYFVSAARTTTKNLRFKHVTGGIKFSLSRSDIKKASLVSNDGNGYTAIAQYAVFRLYPDRLETWKESWGGTDVDFGATKIDLTPKEGSTFQSGVYYYIVTRACKLPAGFKLQLYTDEKCAELNISSSVTIQGGHFLSADNIDQGLEWKAVSGGFEDYTFDPIN